MTAGKTSRRAAMDSAAVAAEHMLDRHNGDTACELALDVLADYVGRVNPYLCIEDRPGRWLAWALMLTERRTDLAPHEAKLLSLAWERVREDAVQRTWERLGA